MMSEKVTKSMPKGSQNDAKIDPKIFVVHVFSKKAKMPERICFSVKNVVLGT